MKCRLKLSALGTIAKFIFNMIVTLLALIFIVIIFSAISYGLGYITVHWFNIGFAMQANSDSNYYLNVGTVEFLFIIVIAFGYIITAEELKHKKYYGFGWLIECKDKKENDEN